MSKDTALEISTVLADLAELLERKDEATTKAIAEAVRSAAVEISTPLVDLLLAIEKSGTEGIRAIAEALATQRMQPVAPQAAPVVHVTVPTPEVHVAIPSAAGWRFEVDYLPGGAIKGLTAKRLPG